MSGDISALSSGRAKTSDTECVTAKRKARGLAAEAIYKGTVSQVAVEENRKGRWVLVPKVVRVR
jgi:hypothetical protein